MKLGDWLNQASAALSGLERPRLEAQILAKEVLGRSRTWVTAHPEFNLQPDELIRLDHYVTRRAGGEPLPYIIGHWEFYWLDFYVTPAVLIPRPETELLVETALNWLDEHPGARIAADVGTGSGCIAVSISSNNPTIRIVATDLSMMALRIARSNVQRHHVDNHVYLLQADLLAPLTGPFDLVCANLPYIPSVTLDKLDVRKYEPVLALDGGTEGLDYIARLLNQLPERMSPGGLAMFEIEANQGEQALSLAREAFPSAATEILPDLAKQPRLLKIMLK